MIKLKKKNIRAKEEEAKEKEEEDPTVEKKQKKPPGELRLMKEITELDLPPHAKVNFSEDQIMSFSVSVNLKNEDCLWQGGIY